MSLSLFLFFRTLLLGITRGVPITVLWSTRSSTLFFFYTWDHQMMSLSLTIRIHTIRIYIYYYYLVLWSTQSSILFLLMVSYHVWSITLPDSISLSLIILLLCYFVIPIRYHSSLPLPHKYRPNSIQGSLNRSIIIVLNAPGPVQLIRLCPCLCGITSSNRSFVNFCFIILWALALLF